MALRLNRVKVTAKIPIRRKILDQKKEEINETAIVKDEIKEETTKLEKEINKSSENIDTHLINDSNTNNDTLKSTSVKKDTDNNNKESISNNLSSRRFRLKVTPKLGVRSLNENEKSQNDEKIKNIQPQEIRNETVEIDVCKELNNNSLTDVDKSNENSINNADNKSAKVNLLLSKTNSFTLKPPPSPSKISRLRIRSMPKLGLRRNSISTESDEESVRKTPIKKVEKEQEFNETVLNVSNVLTNKIKTESLNEIPSQNLNNVKRKGPQSDMAKKMAEAKRDFLLKFGAAKPDRQRMTMRDLIFYNPTTNPLIENVDKKPLDKKEINLETVENIKNDIIDEKTGILEEESDDDESIPVPQVKIGPNGEIILDKESLLISTTASKKVKTLTSTAINYDDLNTGYGVFNRKRAKDWSLYETKRFYRVLHMIGTDFTSMLEFFPGRSRRDLKVKFKKEEKINRELIDQIFLNPPKFDLEDLKETLKNDEEMEKKRVEENLLKQKLKKRRVLDVVVSDSDYSGNEEDEEEFLSKKTKNKSIFSRCAYRINRIKKEKIEAKKIKGELTCDSEEIQITNDKHIVRIENDATSFKLDINKTSNNLEIEKCTYKIRNKSKDTSLVFNEELVDSIYDNLHKSDDELIEEIGNLTEEEYSISDEENLIIDEQSNSKKIVIESIEKVHESKKYFDFVEKRRNAIEILDNVKLNPDNKFVKPSEMINFKVTNQEVKSEDIVEVDEESSNSRIEFVNDIKHTSTDLPNKSQQFDDQTNIVRTIVFNENGDKEGAIELNEDQSKILDSFLGSRDSITLELNVLNVHNPS